MWVLMVLAGVWVIALTPMVLRRFSDRNVVTSVTTFRRQLLRLGSTWRPAHKSLIPGTALGFSAATLRVWEERYTPSGPGIHENGSGARGGRPDPVRLDENSFAAAAAAMNRGRTVTPSVRARGGSSESAAVTRRTTTARRRRVVICLGAVTGLFLLLGAVPAARMLWGVALLSLALLLGYLAALIHVHRLAVERARRVDALAARRHVVSALDHARRTTFMRAGTSRFAASSRSVRGASSRSGSPFGSGAVDADSPLEKQAASGSR